MIDILLTSLIEFIESKKDHIDGQVDIEHVIDAKKRFANSFNEYIDYRVALKFEDRRKSMSQERIASAETLHSAIQSTASSVRSLSALNSAPIPPVNHSDEKAMKVWTETYNEWFNNDRKKAMKIG